MVFVGGAQASGYGKGLVEAIRRYSLSTYVFHHLVYAMAPRTMSRMDKPHATVFSGLVVNAAHHSGVLMGDPQYAIQAV